MVAGYGGEIHVADDANGNAKIKIYIPKAESAPVRGARTAPRAAPPAWRGVDDPAARLAELQARARERNRAKRERKRLQKQALQEQVHSDEAEQGPPVRPSPLQPTRADIEQRSAVSQQPQAAQHGRAASPQQAAACLQYNTLSPAKDSATEVAHFGTMVHQLNVLQQRDAPGHVMQRKTISVV